MAASGEQPAKRVRLSSGLKALNKGIEVLDKNEDKDNLQYIITALKGERNDQIKNIANWLKNLPKPHGMGAKIRTRKNMKFSQLPPKFVKGLLKSFCMDNQAQQEAITDISANDALDTLYFAINVCGSSKLPDNYESLAYESPLEELCKQRYCDLGERLKDRDLTDPSWGYFYVIEGKKLGLLYPEATISHPLVPNAEDWVFSDNYTLSAKMSSKALGATISCAERFGHLDNITLIDEHEDWFDRMATNKVPKIVLRDPADFAGMTPMTACSPLGKGPGNGSSPAALTPPPRGNGRVRATT